MRSSERGVYLGFGTRGIADKALRIRADGHTKDAFRKTKVGLRGSGILRYHHTDTKVVLLGTEVDMMNEHISTQHQPLTAVRNLEVDSEDSITRRLPTRRRDSSPGRTSRVATGRVGGTNKHAIKCSPLLGFLSSRAFVAEEPPIPILHWAYQYEIVFCSWSAHA